MRTLHFYTSIALLTMLPLIGRTQVQCTNDSTGLIPLVDLGTAYYENVQGGLYPNGLNYLTGKHKKNGINISKALKPLDSLGNIDYANGEIIILGMGASVASNAYNAYLDSLHWYEWEGVNNCLALKGMFAGGKDLTTMVDLSDPTYWRNIRQRMDERGDAYAQVQLVWLMQNSDFDTTSVFADYYASVMAKYISLMQILKDTFPNLKQVYISTMHYGGYIDPTHIRYDALHEPRTYWNGLVVKDLIRKQINGDPALKYTGLRPQAAWMCWGPYFWTDGKNPRKTDGLNWTCDQFRTDETGGGFHLVDSAYALGVEAQILWDFFTTDPVASLWHNMGDLWSACPEEYLAEGPQPKAQNSLLIYPNPVSSDRFTLLFPEEPMGELWVEVYDTRGDRVYAAVLPPGNGKTAELSMQLPAGFYLIRTISGWQLWEGRFVHM